MSVALTNEQLAKLKCDHCGKPFRTYPKPDQYNLPDEIPFVDGGIVIVNDEGGILKHYHGYVGNKHQCFEQAMDAENSPKPDFKDEEGWAIRLD